MIKNPIEYKNKVYIRNDTSLIDKDDQFIVSGDPNMYTTNSIYTEPQLPMALYKHKPPINIDDLADIYCGIYVTFFVTKHDIYSSYTPNIYLEGEHHVINYDKHVGRKIDSHDKKSFGKVILPNNITLSLSSHIKKIVSGKEHSVILMNNNRMLIFGGNTYGQLGVGGDIEVIIEPKIVDTDQFDGQIIDVVCGPSSTFILTDKGVLYTTFVIIKENDPKMANIIDMLETPAVYGFTKLCIDKKIVKISAMLDILFFLTSDGFLYGTAMLPYEYKNL